MNPKNKLTAQVEQLVYIIVTAQVEQFVYIIVAHNTYLMLSHPFVTGQF